MQLINQAELLFKVERGENVYENVKRTLNNVSVHGEIASVAKKDADETLFGGENWNACYPEILEKGDRYEFPYRPA